MTLPTMMIAMAGPGGGQGSGNPIEMFFPMIVLFAILYFMMIRPQQRREKERKAMISATKSGDKILFSGGILGTVTNAKDNTLMVKIADGVKIEVARGAVSRVVEKGESVSADPDTK